MSEYVIGIAISLIAASIFAFLTWVALKLRKLFADVSAIAATTRETHSIHVKPDKKSLFQIERLLAPVESGNQISQRMAAYTEALYHQMLLMARSDENVDQSKVDDINNNLLRDLP